MFVIKLKIKSNFSVSLDAKQGGGLQSDFHHLELRIRFSRKDKSVLFIARQDMIIRISAKELEHEAHCDHIILSEHQK